MSEFHMRIVTSDLYQFNLMIRNQVYFRKLSDNMGYVLGLNLTGIQYIVYSLCSIF